MKTFTLPIFILILLNLNHKAYLERILFYHINLTQVLKMAKMNPIPIYLHSLLKH